MSGNDPRPIIALTAGDPAGVGPELILAALAAGIGRRCRTLSVGNAEVFRRVGRAAGRPCPFPSLKVRRGEPFKLNAAPAIVDPTTIHPDDIRRGTVSAAGGRAAYESLLWAIAQAKAGVVNAIVTGPLNKEALHLAGINEPGHTEILARECGVSDYGMLYWSRDLAVSMVTIHAALGAVPGLLSADGICRTARLTWRTLERTLGRPPRIALLGLNPHSGEHGLFGDEEARHIQPAISRLNAEGFPVAGPLPADTAFTPANRGRYDGFVAMYHDQGSIPFKMLHFDDGVNHTMGLPIVRTSVDHGTAYDIAWQGKASTGSLMAAIDLALLLAGK